MLISPDRVEVLSLVNRCACGRQISDNKTSCLACANEHTRLLAGEIHCEEDLERALELVPADRAREVLEKLKPHLDIRSW